MELNENLRCIILDSYANRIGKSRVIASLASFIGVDCLLSAITIRTMDGLGYKLHGGNSSVLTKFDKAAVCGSGG